MTITIGGWPHGRVPLLAEPRFDSYTRLMKTVRVRVENGRITGDAPQGFPEGEVDLRLAEPEDELSEQDLARLDEALARGFQSIGAGRFRPAADVIARLRRE